LQREPGLRVKKNKGFKVGILAVLSVFVLMFTFSTHHLRFATPLLTPAWAQPVPPGTVTIQEDIRATRHNLSTTGLGDVTSGIESEVCVFCHTPHGAASQTFAAPIWNRNLAYQDTTGYVLYDQAWSFSFEGTLENPAKPTGFSRLCLSCHDGVIALGSVINKPGSGGYLGGAPTTDTLGIGAMGSQPSAVGAGMLTGDTRVLGTNLQNDHPVSFVFDSVLATAIDTELVDPGPSPTGLNAVTPLAPAGGYKTGTKRYPGNDPSDPINQVQCTSCHNPHAVTYPKFLRAPRFQDATETGYLVGDLTRVAPAGQIICLYCHSKPGWDGSTHDLSQAIHAAYPDEDDTNTKHPENYDFDGVHNVGQVACRNCHDPHTAQGAKRLHREGVDAFGAGNAIENTCYLCHSPNTSKVSPVTTFLPAGDPTGDTGTPYRFVGDGTTSNGFRIAPDIWTQFNKDQSACIGGSGGYPNGSGMCLQLPTLAAGHEPVFLFRSQEGVQLNSEGVALRPANNEETPGITTADERHVECVDCHNPHQVNSPNLLSLAYNINDPSNAKGGRFKGMKGVGIDISGIRPIVVGRFGAADTDIDGKSANRDPYVYEVCFRCHGNSYENIFKPNRYPDDLSVLSVPAQYASYPSIPFSSRTDPTNGITGDALSFRGFSNKWLEFNPETDDLDQPKVVSIDLARFGQLVPSHTQQLRNPAYHPVVKPGRNRSPQLCKQLAQAFDLTGCKTGPNTPPPTPTALAELDTLTIQCTDCHNSDKYDAYKNDYASIPKNSPAGLVLGLLGPLTESNLRVTDVDPDLNTVVNYITGRPTETTGVYPSGPIGPHGSTHRRILRANYDTDILKAGRCFEQGNPTSTCTSGDGYSGTGGHQGGGSGVNNAHFQEFLLCFQCHDRAAFDPTVTSTYYGQTSSDTDRSLTRFFGTIAPGTVDSWWEGNLHMYHLRWSGAMCHECHYNIHSNVEAVNTIYGDGTGGMLPPDGTDDGNAPDGVIGTHLINFAPTVEGTTGLKPIWFYDGTAFRCYLRCHNEVMDSCAYQSSSSGTPNARWCAGGRNPGTSG
jgi:predicted CXXCH cytochrome family protein